VLLVEDNATNRRVLSLQTQTWGMLAFATASGDEALGWLGTMPPFDVAILDMNMPGSSGAEVLTEIRADPVTAGIRVIVVTADGEEGRGRAMAIGADEYFTKPFSPITLLSTVEQVLSSPAREPEA